MTNQTNPMPTFYALGLSPNEEQRKNPEFSKLEIPLRSIFDLHFDKGIKPLAPVRILGGLSSAEVKCEIRTPIYNNEKQWVAAICADFNIQLINNNEANASCTKIHSLEFAEISYEDADCKWFDLKHFVENNDTHLVLEKIEKMLHNFSDRMMFYFDDIDWANIVDAIKEDRDKNSKLYSLAKVSYNQEGVTKTGELFLKSEKMSNTQINDEYKLAAKKAITAHFASREYTTNVRELKILEIARSQPILPILLNLYTPLNLDKQLDGELGED